VVVAATLFEATTDFTRYVPVITVYEDILVSGALLSKSGIQRRWCKRERLWGLFPPFMDAVSGHNRYLYDREVVDIPPEILALSRKELLD
jgi:hypothetical protein